jgi:hypothetical protein
MHGTQKLPIVVAGSGRSGTTWIGNTLAAAAGAFSIFEPLAPWGIAPPAGAVRLGGAPGLYLPHDEPHPEWVGLWADIFSGAASNAWTRQDWRYVPEQLSRWKLAEKVAYRLVGFRHPFQVRLAQRPLVKAIYSNLMLPWLARVHSFQLVYIVRHPCAVVASRLRLGWPDSLEGIFRQPELLRDYLVEYEPIIRRAGTPVERMAALWCVENLIPLRNWDRGWHLACYEYLTDTPVDEFRRLVHSLDLPFPEAALRSASRLSSTAGPSAGREIPWHAQLSEADGDCVLRTCAEFGLDFYGRSFKPICNPVEWANRPAAVESQRPSCRASGSNGWGVGVRECWSSGVTE